MTHDPHDAAHPEDPTESLVHAVEHLAHHLPGQAVIAEFVHHNTLHGDQTAGFAAAVAASAARTGARGYWPEEEHRRRFRAGRVTEADLRATLADHADLRPDEPVCDLPRGRVTRADVLVAALTHDTAPIDAARLRWGIAEEGLTARVHDDILPAAAARLTAPDAVPRLWARVGEVLGLSPTDAHPEHLADLTPGLAQVLGGAPAAEVVTALAEHARRRHALLLDGAAPRTTLREIVRALTGHDSDARVHPALTRWLGAFLDEGTAAWTLDARDRGLWRALRRHGRDEAWEVQGMPGVGDRLARLPDDPARAVAALLDELGVDAGRRADWLEASALRLPGFFGMIGWRAARPDWPAQATAPAALMDALAVRLTLDAAALDAICREHLGCAGTLPGLRARFASPMEAMIREALFAGRMPAHLAERARVQADEGGDEAAWQAIGEAWWTWSLTTVGNLPGRPSMARTGWPLFRLAMALGWTADDLAVAPVPVLQGLLDTLTPDRRGLLWLEAYERHYRDEVLDGLAHNGGRGRWRTRDVRPAWQVAFCIDDREEAYRRHLEEHVPDVETFGVAGFFGVPMRYRGLDDRDEAALCPPAVTAVHQVRERPRAGEPDAAHAAGVTLLRRTAAALQRLRTDLAAQVAGAFAGPLWGAAAAVRLTAPLTWEAAVAGVHRRIAPDVLTRLDLTRDAAPPAAGPRAGFTLDEQADRVHATLRNIGLTRGFSRLVVWMGHGSHSRNNPHMAAYDCGACGGRHGGPNARAFAAMANHPEVRQRLRARGIDLPDDTWFIGAEHDTCDDRVTWYDRVDLPQTHEPDLAAAQAALDHASRGSAHERCRRFASAPARPTPWQALRHVTRRAKDPFQPRPELGHVTNAAAVVGRRALTRGLFLDRRAFLVSYDPTIDPTGSVVEGILLAVGPVGAGINLEYYFSTVDGERYGCGSKVTHNLAGNIGVLDGTGGDLRTGLPRQMIEIHEPMRLLLLVEQTPEILGAIYARQPAIAELVGGEWLQLVSIDPTTGAAARFVAGRGFVPWTPTRPDLPRAATSTAWYDGHDDGLGPALIGGDHA